MLKCEEQLSIIYLVKDAHIGWTLTKSALGLACVQVHR